MHTTQLNKSRSYRFPLIFYLHQQFSNIHSEILKKNTEEKRKKEIEKKMLIKNKHCVQAQSVLAAHLFILRDKNLLNTSFYHI